MKIKRKQVCFIAIVGMVIICTIYFRLSKSAIYESATKAMVYITNQEQGGNGSIYKIEDDRLIVVTTYHLLQDSDTVMVYFQDQTIAEGNVIAVNEKHDVGFVVVDNSQLTTASLAELSSVVYDKASFDKVEAGDAMEYRYLEWNGGHVSATSQKGSIGHMNWYIEDFDDYFIYNYCDVTPGMSGCAAVAEDGTYLGMMVGGASNESGALSAQTIEKIYADIE